MDLLGARGESFQGEDGMAAVGSAWTAERVLAMALDPASAQAGQGLGSPRKWSNLGQMGNLVWGECQGSGKTPYQTKIALEDPAFSCSCPSRKFPCKHVLGLMLVWVNPATTIDDASPPGWVVAWSESRAKKAEGKRQKAESPVNSPARSKREAARISKVAAGLEDLDLWLGDLVRSGFASLGSRSKNLWDEQARRMIDAQCPGVARRFRQIDAMTLAGEGWQAALLDRLAQIHLLIEGFRHLTALPSEVADDVKAAIGFPVDLDAIRSGTLGTTVRDTWRVLGQAFAIEDKVTVRRTSLWGQDTLRSAILLDFSAAGRPFVAGYEPGSKIDSTLGFFPGAAPIRALVIERHSPPEPFGKLEGGATVQEAQASFGVVLARSPWVEMIPVVLAEISLRQIQGMWSAVDASGAQIPLPRGFDQGWNIEAISGGEPFTLTGEFDGSTLNSLSAIIDGRFLPLVASGKKLVADLVCGSPGRWLIPDSALLLEATASAVVGVDRKPPPTVPPDHPVGSVMAQVQARPAPARLLAVAAAGGLYARVGRNPRVDLSCSPDRAPATEDRPKCSPEATRRLRSLLAGELAQETSQSSNRLFEWFDCCQEAGQCLPADLLVEVLTLCQTQTAHLPALASILGNRGRWLAGRNPDWKRFAAPRTVEDSASTWATGTEAERLALLRQLRATDPDEARRLVESTFRSEPASLRPKILGLFDTNLAANDEPFLEAALDDRSREVRSIAAERLRDLPGSRLSGRMAERARAILRWEGVRLAIDPPSTCDKAMIRDGITEEPRPYGLFGKKAVGKKAWYLHEILARTPVSAIGDHLGRPPEVIIAAARFCEWAEEIGTAWETSALLNHDLAWSRALALARIAVDDVQDDVAFPKLLGTLEPEVRDAQIASKLATPPIPLKKSDPALRMIAASDGVFGIELGRMILQRIRAALANERQEASEDINLSMKSFNLEMRTLILEADRKLPFPLIDEISPVFDQGRSPHFASEVTFSLNASFDAMLDRWKFRRAMHQEFSL